MNDFLVDNFTKAPKGKKAKANQIGFCLITALVILFVVSTLVSNVYVSALESQRKTALSSFTSSISVALAHKDLVEGMDIPLACPEYEKGKPYITNVYVKAGNSFLRVYTSDKSYDENKQYVLSGAGDEYTESYEQQLLVVTHRKYEDVMYVTSVAPIIGTDGTVSGIVEVMQPQSDFSATVNGMSLSWIFTMISIAVAIAIIYGEMHRLLDTLIRQPDKTVPKSVMYGMSTFRLIAFFSSIGCSMPLIVLSEYLKDSMKDYFDSSIVIHIWIIFACSMFLLGFWRFVHLRDLLIRRLTARIAAVVSAVSAFVLLLLCGVIDFPFLTVFMQLPIGFFLGMLFQFQREYRLFAARSGHDEFSERKVHQTQYSGYLLGAAVGAVICGILYERFGLFAVLMVASFFLFVCSIQILYFVRHCPPSNEPVVRLPNYIYALKNSKSGTFCWSAIFPLGLQFAFFLVFVPDYLDKVQIALATVSFYYMVGIVCGQVIMKVLLIWFEDFFTAKTRITLSAILSSIGYLAFSLMPSAKALVIGVTFLGLSLGLHEFGYLDYYKSLIRQDKHPIARVILMRTFTCGILIGTIAFGVANAFTNVRLPMIAISLIILVISASYPILTLMDNSQTKKSGKRPNRPQVPQNRYRGV
ncbi:MAG: MotA/TolQ/ExbB proton channel family protein [Clostridiales bacterium]|nr:MotA/TolQ/ExbB proton channel family protein [Clostridiales bacterium]